MLNGLKQFQNVMVIGGKSEIAIETIKNVPLVSDANVFLLGRHIELEDLTINGAHTVLLNYDISHSAERIETVSKLLDDRDFDLVVIAVGYLGSRPDVSNMIQDQEVLSINFSHSAEVLKYIANRLKIQNHGKVLILSSVASIRPRKSNYVYGAAKAGLDFLARGLQLDLEGTGAEICIARPGFVHSRMTQGMAPAPFAISATKAGELCAKGVVSSRKLFYVPGVLRYVMFVVKYLPKSILNKLN